MYRKYANIKEMEYGSYAYGSSEVGGIFGVAPAACTKVNASSAPGDLVHLKACPDDGTAPYIVRFLAQFGGAPTLLSGAGLSGSAEQSVAIDGGCTTGPGTGGTVTYQISDAEIVASAGGSPAADNVDGSGIAVPTSAPGTVRFLIHVADSCPTGSLHCVQYCDLTIVCTAPVCNFVVT